MVELFEERQTLPGSLSKECRLRRSALWIGASKSDQKDGETESWQGSDRSFAATLDRMNCHSSQSQRRSQRPLLLKKHTQNPYASLTQFKLRPRGGVSAKIRDVCFGRNSYILNGPCRHHHRRDQSAAAACLTRHHECLSKSDSRSSSIHLLRLFRAEGCLTQLRRYIAYAELAGLSGYRGKQKCFGSLSFSGVPLPGGCKGGPKALVFDSMPWLALSLPAFLGLRTWGLLAAGLLLLTSRAWTSAEHPSELQPDYKTS